MSRLLAVNHSNVPLPSLGIVGSGASFREAPGCEHRAGDLGKKHFVVRLEEVGKDLTLESGLGWRPDSAITTPEIWGSS